MKKKKFTITDHYLLEVEYASGHASYMYNWEVVVATFKGEKEDEIKVKLVESSRKVTIDWYLIPQEEIEIDTFIAKMIKKKLDSF